MHVRKLSVIILLLLAIVSGKAQPVFVLHDTMTQVNMGPLFFFYEDKSGKMPFGKIQQAKFAVKNVEVPNFNITQDAIWGRMKFTTSKASSWYLRLDPASFNDVVFYQQKNHGRWMEQHIGNAYPRHQRPLQVNHFMFRLDLQPGDTTEVYLKVQDYYPIQFEMSAGTIESFVGPFHSSNLYNGICYGIMIMMLIYNFYLFVSQRSIVYFYYVLYVFCSMVFSAYLSGYALYFPTPLLSIIQFAPIIPPAGFGVFGLLFTLRLFNEDLTPRFRRIVYIFIIVAVSDVIISAIPSLVHLSESIIQPLGLVLGILCISGAIIARRHSSAKYYLVGFGAYMFALFYLILTAQGVFSMSEVATHAMPTGSAIESILLSFALGDKLKVSLREKEKAQEQALAQATENERLVKEQNIVLEQKVKERTAELEEKNKEVLDSIHYARRIQQALLAHEEFLNKNMPEHFVLFRPKDIVSGDFYWASVSSENKDKNEHLTAPNSDPRTNNFYLAVCDSTGHGVPGAFMSLLNISFLNEAIVEKDIASPAKVFDHVRQRLIGNLSQDGGKDGMDGILCCFKKEQGSSIFTHLSYSAANNAPLLIRNSEVVVLEKDKMPVGKGEKEEAFSLYTISLQKGDHLYLYTDGFGDQFGGPKGKKFKHRQLSEKLLEMHQLSMSGQKKSLEKIFSEWKGSLEQVDDVLVIGIRI